jgi:hypothetical protein
VPVISIDEDHQLCANEDEIRPAGKPRHMLAKPETAYVKQTANHQLRPRVLASDERHRATALFWREIVHYVQWTIDFMVQLPAAPERSITK